MTKKDYETILSIAMSTGADFAEVYYEEAQTKVYNFNDSKLDTIVTSNKKGVGIRVIKDEEYFYSSSNNLDMNSLCDTARKLAANISNSIKDVNIKLNELEVFKQKAKIPHDDFPATKKKEILQKADTLIRNKYKEVTQAALSFREINRDFIIANSDGKFIQSDNTQTRFLGIIYTQRGNIKENEITHYGEGTGYEFLENFNIEEELLAAASEAVKKLDAEDFKGGELPVIIAPGFGAVIFHEACGHGLESTAVAPKLSIFSDSLGKKIGSEKVTIIDDGTIENMWGSNIIDSEGHKTKKTILIENGILKNYLVDKIGGIIMNKTSTGCGRRESYEYAPTSRMSNTYLAPGTDKIEDMFASIDLGVYCKSLSGGTVNPATGDFNFAVDNAFLIEHGKITKQLRGVTLIGNGKDILNNVEMVSDDLLLSDGYCGSKSGFIEVSVGQPTIKISKILVGGKE